MLIRNIHGIIYKTLRGAGREGDVQEKWGECEPER
jgi:hypothetical protein